MKPERINSLTGLRALAMITIFCCHLSYLAGTPFQNVYSLIKNGRFGVNFFLVLSGFVLALSYSSKLNGNDLSRDVQFVKKRISKIYIPYIITMVLAIPLYISVFAPGENLLDIKLFIIRLAVNIGMIQSLIPFEKYSVSINDVSWFISTIFIIYLLTPGILRLNNKAAKHYTLSKLVLPVFAVLGFYCCVYMAIRQIEYVRFADHGLSIIYTSPLTRIFPFLLGIAGYNIYSLLRGLQIKKGSLIETAGMALFFLWWITADQTGLPTVVTECIDMLVSMVVILVFAISKRGIVSAFLSKESMIHLGNISLEFYLIHNLVISYGMMAAEHFTLSNGTAVLLLTILYFALSLFGAELIHYCSERLLPAIRKNTY